MSTAVSTCPNQLCFPWMQSENGSNRSRTKPAKIARARRNPIDRQLTEVAASKESSLAAMSPVTLPTANLSTSTVSRSVSQALSQAGSQTSQNETNLAVASTQRTNVSAQVASTRDGMRVGQVRIGNVMLSLLKKYGITDQEIADVLSSIAQEKCQGLAG